MELGLNEKNVFVTASTSGIGKAIAESFLKEGATVIINGRNKNKLEKTCKELSDNYGKKVYAVCADMAEEKEIERAAGKIKEVVHHVDVVIGNLGTGKAISDDKFDLNEWKYMLNINLLSAVGLIQNMKALFPNTGGSVVLLASLAAHDRIGAPPAYAASKAGIVSLVKYAAPILIENGIRINAVSPGNVLFEGGRWEELTNLNPEGTKKYIEDEVLMKRFGNVEEIANAVIFLCSNKSEFTTGTVLRIDGGQGRGI